MSMIVGVGWLCVVQSGSAGAASMRVIDPAAPTATVAKRAPATRGTVAQWVDPNAPPVLSTPARSAQLLNTGVDKTPPQPPEPETSDDPAPPVAAPAVVAAAPAVAAPAVAAPAVAPPPAPPATEAVAAPAARPPVIPSRPPAAPRVMLAATQPAAADDDDGGKRWTVRGAPIGGGRAPKAEPPPKTESADARRARAAQDLAAKQLM